MLLGSHGFSFSFIPFSTNERMAVFRFGMALAMGFVVGWLANQVVSLLFGLKSSSLSNKMKLFTVIRNTQTDLPSRLTSHHTSKIQLVEPFALHPQLAGMSIAELRSGQKVETHVHESLIEIFVVLQGRLGMEWWTTPTDGASGETRIHSAPPGSVLVTAPHEPHAFFNGENSTTKMLVFQIVNG